MPIDKTQYHKIAFYSGFSYLHTATDMDPVVGQHVRFFSGFDYDQVLWHDQINVTLTSVWPTAQKILDFPVSLSGVPRFEVQFLYDGKWLPIGEVAIASATNSALYLTQISGSSLTIRYWIFNTLIDYASITSHDSGFGSQTVDGTTITIPDSVISRPALIRHYIEYDGKYHLPSMGDGITVGSNTTTIFANGFNNNAVSWSDVFKVHYIIYDRAADGSN